MGACQSRDSDVVVVHGMTFALLLVRWGDIKDDNCVDEGKISLHEGVFVKRYGTRRRCSSVRRGSGSLQAFRGNKWRVFSLLPGKFAAAAVLVQGEVGMGI